ncbi:FAD-binding protein [bacterium]|nr:FAD-binding protein [candidate division CSSED10-310 bacterium]
MNKRTSGLSEVVLAGLREIVGNRCRTSTAELYVYGFDGGIHHRSPDAVVQPVSSAEVSALLKLAGLHGVPVVPRGAGSALCGHSVPVDGGIVLDMQRMNAIKEIRVPDLYCVVEPGVVHQRLNEALKPHRFFIPGPASSEVATLGGMTACNSSGAKAAKYGATRDYVLGMEVVLANGDIIRVGSRTLKGSSGYQLEKLFVGMEGTLGVITEITLRLAPLPETRAAVVAYFTEIAASGRCVADIIAHPILPEQLELMNRTCIQAVNKAAGLGLQECGAILLIELGGHPAQVKDQVEIVKRVATAAGAFKLDYTDEEQRIEALWQGRKQMIPSLSSLHPDYVTVMLADDMAVPISRVPEAVVEFERIAAQYDIIIPPYGHAADGNLHTKVLMDPTNPDHWRQAEKAVAEIYDAVLAMGGTVTGEHGVAITKAQYFLKERASALDAMKAVKAALDPQNILNPHKLFQWEHGFLHYLRYPVEVDHGA